MGITSAITIGAGMAASGIAGGIASSQGAKSAAGAQTQATDQSLALLQQGMARANPLLSPFIGSGVYGQQLAQGLLTNYEQQQIPTTAPGPTPLMAVPQANYTPYTPFQPTMAQLQQTPGYQFTLQQGLQGAQNSAAAQGLGTSGQALAGAANYSEGLASTTYQQQLQNYINQYLTGFNTQQAQFGANMQTFQGNFSEYQNYYNQLMQSYQAQFSNQLAQRQSLFNQAMGLSASGQNAATGLANIGIGVAGQGAGLTQSLGVAQAGAAEQQAQALGGIFGNLSNAATTAFMPSFLQSMNSGNALGASMSSGPSADMLNYMIGSGQGMVGNNFLGVGGGGAGF